MANTDMRRKLAMMLDSYTVTVSGIPPLSTYKRRLISLKAFGGTEQRNLPAGYTQINYVNMLEGSYIRVENLPISAGYKVEFDFRTTATLGNGLRNYLGGRAPGVSAGGGFRLSKLAPNNNERVVFYGFETGTEYYDPTTQFQANTRYKYTYDNGVCTLESGGSVISTNTFTVTDTTSTDWGINDYCSNGAWSTYHENIYVYSVKVWDDQGELVMDLVPAKTSTEIGFYDAVTGGFRGPTSGTFEAGEDTVPTPTTPMDIVSNNGVLKARHQSGLPIGYQFLSSLTADGRCLVNTGIVLQEGDEIDLDYAIANPQPGTLPGDRFLFGTANVNVSQGGTWVEVYTTSGSMSNPAWYVRFASTASINSNLQPTTLSGHLSLKRGQFIVNGETYLTPEYSGNFQTTPLTLFGRYDSSQLDYKGAKMTASHFTVKNGNAYRFNGVMVKRISDNALGVYDLVSDTFCENIGDGTFTAGTAVSDPVVGYADSTVETITVTPGGSTVTTEMLLNVGDYQDVQSILDGIVTRNIGVLVLDGTENWSLGTVFTLDNAVQRVLFPSTSMSTHFVGNESSTAPNMFRNNSFKVGASEYRNRIYIKATQYADETEFKAFLAQQYANGTPVIIVYPLETPTTESVAGQGMVFMKGLNTVEITQAGLVNLELEVKAR